VAETPALLEVEHLQKTFEVRAGIRTLKLHAVTDVSFTVSDGRVTVIVGESGCGKSTIVRLIARLLTPTSGTIRFGGKSYGGRLRRRELLRLRSEVQMIFQDPFGSLNPSYTIGYHLSRPLFNYRKCRTAGEARERALQTLESVGLTPAVDYIDKYPHELSGGQRQRVVIARALIVEPKLILADEPTSMLDVSIRMDILNLMRKLQRERNLAFLFITHDLASARYIGDDLLVMYAGELVEGGPVDDVVSTPAHPYTRLLLSAVPDVERNLMLEGETAPGEPPDLSQLPTGCRFHPRCPLATDVCRREAPKRVQVGANHWAACHAVQESLCPQVTLGRQSNK
jgi:peptide/nickel transport system ATP-binding protein